MSKGRAMASGVSQSMRHSYRSGQAGAWKATGGKNEVGVGMSDAANDPSFAGSWSASSAAVSGSDISPSTPPEWAQRMKRSSTVSHGVSTAAHTVRSADHSGGSMSVSLNQDDR